VTGFSAPTGLKTADQQPWPSSGTPQARHPPRPWNRQGPGADVLPKEIGDLDEASDIYVVEVKLPGDYQSREVVVTFKEFTDKIVPKDKKLEDVIEGGRFLRGRRPGGR
jgi:hypothetical protein